MQSAPDEKKIGVKWIAMMCLPGGEHAKSMEFPTREARNEFVLAINKESHSGMSAFAGTRDERGREIWDSQKDITS